MKRAYTIPATRYEYFFSLSYRAGDTNRNISNRIYGEASKTANMHDTVICVINCADNSVLINGILYSGKCKYIPHELIKSSIYLKVIKSDLCGARRIVKVSLLKQKTIPARITMTNIIRVSILRKILRCPPNERSLLFADWSLTFISLFVFFAHLFFNSSLDFFINPSINFFI